MTHELRTILHEGNGEFNENGILFWKKDKEDEGLIVDNLEDDAIRFLLQKVRMALSTAKNRVNNVLQTEQLTINVDDPEKFLEGDSKKIYHFYNEKIPIYTRQADYLLDVAKMKKIWDVVNV